MVLVQLEVTMKKNTNQHIHISLYKAQVQVDQGYPHKTRYTEAYRGKSGEEPWTHGYQGKLIAYALGTRIDTWDLIKLQSFGKAKDTVIRTKMATNRLEEDFYQSYIW